MSWYGVVICAGPCRKEVGRLDVHLYQGWEDDSGSHDGWQHTAVEEHGKLCECVDEQRGLEF